MKSIFAFGRFNPPTIGHQELLCQLKLYADATERVPFVFLSHSVDSKKNPLCWEKKVFYFKQFFPESPIVESCAVKTVEDAIRYMETLGFKDIMMIVGEDRVNQFQWIENYKTDYKIDRFKIVSAGKRDTNAGGVVGATASKARQYVKDGDFEGFKAIIPGERDHAAVLYHDLKKYLEN